MKVPILSICIPTYCQIDFLRETLISVKSQDFNDYEIIISDDTPDGSVAQLITSFDFGGRLRYHHNTVPLGSPENWNAAIRHANGKYIKLLHHDDKLLHSGVMSAFVKMLDDHQEADFAFCASLVEDISSGKDRIHRPTVDQLMKLSNTPESLFFGNFIGAPSATIYRNNLGIEYDCCMKWLVDIDFYIRVLQHNKSFIYTDEVLIATPTNALHQVTEICKNNAEIEFFEYLRLYRKLASILKKDQNTRYVWFRLFERYRVFSQKDFNQLGVKLTSHEAVLAYFFDAYRRERLQRYPRRIYTRLPEPFKRVIRCIRQNLMQIKQSNNERD